MRPFRFHVALAYLYMTFRYYMGSFHSREAFPDVSSTLAPSVSGSLLGYTWYLVVAVLRDRHIIAVLRDSSLWLSVLS